MLNLDDFSTLFISNFDDKTRQSEDVEKLYEKKLEELKKYYESRLKEEREKAFKHGYESGRREAEEFYKKVLQSEKRNYEDNLKKEIDLLKREFKQLAFSLKEENIKLGRRILEAVSESLEEIFEFLFIQDSNLSYLKEKLQEVIDDFKMESEPVSIEVSEKFAEILKDVEGLTVKVNENIKDGDFVVRFKDFSVVHDLREKLALLREEIEREIKKSSQV
ncbi:hypothetical protein [Desulfurobacterium atlanticum]|uniref:Flagellar assembly protein FliH n=1 Tax=Desulfurobacterium atlanticum TaxID=240169 RepID=A0A238Z0V5_9BACT|nr:hypothetical protein [Desulfurobacterium atlanticum]SNR76464.1 hypothetical protein SAMN06265340_105130 [Desulfurobacterium atlanticum]